MKAVETTSNRNPQLNVRLRRCRRGTCLSGIALILLALQGCAAFHPVRGVPASYVPDEFMAESREGRRQLDPSLLMRTRPEQHLVSGGDILSIYIPRVLGSMSSEVNEVGISPPINMPATAEDPPTVGFPIQVRDDNTVKLPQIPPLNVGGMNLYQVEEAIRRAYTEEHQILKPSEAMIMVSLFRAREHRVLIYRQEFTQESQPQSGQGSLNYGKSRKGTARIVRLRSGENDVAHALTMAGVDGLPGADAENTLYIIRGKGARTMRPAIEPEGGRSPATDPGSLSPVPIHGQQPNPYVVPPGPVQQMGGQRPVNHPQAGYRQIQQMSGVQQAGGLQRADYVVESQASETGSQRIQLMQHSLATRLPYSQPTATPPQYGQPQATYMAQQPMVNGQMLPPNGQMLPPPSSLPGPGHSPYPTAQYPPSMPPVPQTPATMSNFGHSMSVPMNSGMTSPITPIPMQNYAGAEGGFDPMWNQVLANFDPTIDNPNVIRIPLRLRDGEQVAFTEENITLYDGDIVYIESRETEVFYTGGLLGGGQYTLPRDYDLHVLEALSIAESRSSQGGQFSRSIGGVSALNQDVSNSASRLLIIRKLCNGQTARIEVSIVKAMKYDHENILIKPGDMLILQYTFPEACCAFTQRFLLEGALIGIAASTFTGGGGQ